LLLGLVGVVTKGRKGEGGGTREDEVSGDAMEDVEKTKRQGKQARKTEERGSF